MKDAINEAMRDWVTNVKDTHYLIGSAIGPHPFPTIVRDFQSVMGKEAREQVRVVNREWGAHAGGLYLRCSGKLCRLRHDVGKHFSGMTGVCLFCQ